MYPSLWPGAVLRGDGGLLQRGVPAVRLRVTQHAHHVVRRPGCGRHGDRHLQPARPPGRRLSLVLCLLRLLLRAGLRAAHRLRESFVCTYDVGSGMGQSCLCILTTSAPAWVRVVCVYLRRRLRHGSALFSVFTARSVWVVVTADEFQYFCCEICLCCGYC